MGQDKPPSDIVCFSIDDRCNFREENEDCSNLTGSHWDDEPSQDDLGFSTKLEAGASYCLDALDGIHRTQIERRGQSHLKQRIARQQEKLDDLQLKLRHCQEENEALNAEKTAFVRTIARLQRENALLRGQQRATKPKNPPPAPSEYASEYSLESPFAEFKLDAPSVGPVQNSTEDRERRNSPDSVAMTGREFKFDASNDDRNAECKDMGKSDCDCVGKTFARNDFARSQSADLFVEFEDTEARTPRRADGRPYQSLNNVEETEARSSRRVDRRPCQSLHNQNPSRKSADLLVNFGENRRTRRTARRHFGAK